MSETTIRAQLAAIVNAVTGVGKVYATLKLSNQWDEFLTAFKTTIGTATVIRGWMIQSLGFPQDEPVFGNRYAGATLIYRTHTLEMRGLFSYSETDSSQDAVNAITALIVKALNTSSVLHGGQSYSDRTPWASASVQPSMFGSVLCWQAIITQQVVEEVSFA